MSTFEASLHVERAFMISELMPRLSPTGAPWWHRAVTERQFAVQAQYLIDRFPSVELVIGAGAAGSLAPELSIGDVVVGTETVEHDYRQRPCQVEQHRS